MAIVISGTSNDILINGSSVATDTEVSSAVAPKANIADLKEIGVGQTWQDVSSSRVAGVTYTNTTGKPIFVSFFWGLLSNSSTASFTVNGITVTNKANSANQAGLGASFDRVIPDGSTYSYNISSTSVNDYKFLELR